MVTPVNTKYLSAVSKTWTNNDKSATVTSAFRHKFVYFKHKTRVENQQLKSRDGIWTLAQKMTSIRFPENVFAF